MLEYLITLCIGIAIGLYLSTKYKLKIELNKKSKETLGE